MPSASAQPVSSASAPPQVFDVFAEVFEAPPAQRSALLAKLTEGYPLVRAEVEAMLRHDADLGSDALATGAGAALADDSARDQPGAQELLAQLPRLSGDYRVLRIIGEGGMGVVYEAQQSIPRRLVALKAIKPGAMDRRVLERLVREAHILASLAHPGIAQVYELGVTRDDPSQAYLAMELVDGPSITVYCRENKLDLRARVALCIAVCRAVQHAHQRGVIHRDLKPANILVTSSGEPKVLDFGVARAQDAAGNSATLGSGIAGTLGYMAPEQLAGDADSVDASCDVYALGAVLYELLSGKGPYDLAGLSLGQAIAKVKAERPRNLAEINRACRGDLQLITSAAMHPDRERRYSSPAALAEDLQRWLDGHAISARRDSPGYVLAKLAARHKVLVALATALLISLVGFAIFSTVLSRHNRDLADLAQAARLDAESKSQRVALLNETLRVELDSARIDRGRAEGATGKLRLAEDILWQASLDDPTGPRPRWALWELYHRFPCRWIAQGPADATHMAVSPVSGQIVIARGNGELSIHSSVDGAPLFTIPSTGGRIVAMACAPDTQRALVALASGRAYLVDLAPGARPRWLTGSILHAGGARHATFSADGRVIAFAGQDGRVSLWNACTLELLDAWFAGVQNIMAIALSPRGDRLATSTRTPTEANATTVWNVADRSVLRRFDGDTESLACALAFSDDDTVLSTTLGTGLRVASIAQGTERTHLGKLSTFGQLLNVSPGLPAIVAAAENSYLWTQSPELLRPLGQQQYGLLNACHAPGYSVVTLATGGVLRGFDLLPEPGLTRLRGFSSWVFSAAWSGDGEMLAAGLAQGTIAIYDRSLTPIRTIRLGARTRGLVFLKDNKTLVAASGDGMVRLLDARSGSLIRSFRASNSEAYALAIDPSQQIIATGHADRSLKVFDFDSGMPLFSLAGHQRRVEGLVFSGDSKHLYSTGWNDKVHRWNTADWSLDRAIPVSSAAWGIALSPDGNDLAISTHNGTVEVLRTNDLSSRGTLSGHQRLVPAVAFSPDGKLISTGGEDAQVRLWDARTLRPLVTLEPGAGEIVYCTFDPVSGRLAFSAAGRTLGVYDFQPVFDRVERLRPFHTERLKPTE